MKNKLSWMIGGAQGSGVDSAANIFGRACNYGGLSVFGRREYYSNIMGEHSYFHVNVEDRDVKSNTDGIDLLATFDAETIIRHYTEVAPKGGIIYDSRLTGTRLSQVQFLGHRLLNDTAATLKAHSLGDTVGDILELSKRNEVELYPVDYDTLLNEIAAEVPDAKMTQLTRMVNTMAVAASMGLLNFDFEMLQKAIESVFGSRRRVVELNVRAARKTYDHVNARRGENFPFNLERKEVNGKRLFLQGNQAVALGKIIAGCRFQTYYPISPATDESVYLEEKENFDIKLPEVVENPQVEEAALLDGKGSIIVLQTEDEIAAMTSSLGAALSGARASTSTSGPGFDLMVEGIGWAGMNEVPVVVTLYQRGGPSTGLPTRVEQGELKYALIGGHGEFPRIVIASGDQEECFYDTIQAFNYADRYQTVVIHLVDKAIANSTKTFGLFDTSGVKINRGQTILDEEALKQYLDGNGEYKRFRFTENGVSPRVILGVKGGIYWCTGDEHDEFGRITEDPVLRLKIHEKRMNKLKLAEEEIPEEERVNYFGSEEADTIIVSWGSPKGAILDALERFRSEGLKVGFLQMKIMSPFPKKLTSQILSKAKNVIDLEMNYTGQMAALIREQTGIFIDKLIVKYTGRPVSRDEVYEGVKRILNNGETRVVLTSGA